MLSAEPVPAGGFARDAARTTGLSVSTELHTNSGRWMQPSCLPVALRAQRGRIRAVRVANFTGIGRERQPAEAAVLH